MDKQGPQTTKLTRGSAEQNQLTRKGPFSQQTTVFFSKFIQHVKGSMCEKDDDNNQLTKIPLKPFLFGLSPLMFSESLSGCYMKSNESNV